eukprot:GFUD01080791.1.p1 GENE.GFUD01080791.1~~GFUD01080791.1.p1  ORF type:complete len:158 (+),score=53.31 GFUD01080791.1:161-634(+)
MTKDYGSSRDNEVVRSKEDGQGVCSKRRVKVTAMRHNPVRKGQVTVDSTDSGSEESRDNSEASKRRRAMKAFKEARRGAGEEIKKIRIVKGSGSEDGNNSRKRLFDDDKSNSESERGFPRKKKINKAALKINRIESDDNGSWKKSGSSQEDLSSDED